MKVAACQVPDIRDDVDAALSVVHDMARAAEKRSADIVLFPECFLQGYFTDAGNVERLALSLASARFRALMRRLEELQPRILLGLIERSPLGCHNAAVVIERGKVVCLYRKRELLKGERTAFVPGRSSPVFSLAGRRAGIGICYDLRFPRTYQALARRQAEIIFCPCNNMLKAENARIWKHRHHQIRADQCRVSGLWLVSSDVTGGRDGRVSYGPTAVINPDAELVDQVPLGETGMIVVHIPGNGRATVE